MVIISSFILDSLSGLGEDVFIMAYIIRENWRKSRKRLTEFPFSRNEVFRAFRE